jgi:hypothetical protein
MAHFAHIKNNIVADVIVVDNANCGGGNFPQSEAVGQAFILASGIAGEWLQTSYSGSFRGQYAGKDYTYDPDLDEFIAPPQLTEGSNNV